MAVEKACSMPPPAGPARKVIKEHVAVEGTIVHPTGRSGDDFVQRGNNLCHVVVGGVGVDDDAKVSAAFVEVGLLKVADLDGRVDQTIVIGGGEFAVRRARVRGVAMCHPSGTWLKRTFMRRRARVHRIHQNLRQIEEGMMRVELRAEWTGRIDVDLILHDRAAFRALQSASGSCRVRAPASGLPERSFARTQFTYWAKSRI